MRNLLLYFIVLINFISVNAQNVDKNTITALNYIKQGYIKHGVSLLEKASKNNDLSAQFFLAECYYYGIGFDKDINLAFKWARRTAERGLPDAMNLLSIIYSKNHNKEKSNQWEQRFINKGNRLSLPSLNNFYDEGKKYPENYARVPFHGSSEKQIVQNTSPSVNYQQQLIFNNYTIINNDNNITNPAEDATKPTTETNVSPSKSDIDINIPKTLTSKTNTFALIIANEEYQDAPNVEFASNDGEIIAKYFNQTLGIPNQNIRLINNATYNNIKKEIKRLCLTVDACDSTANIIFYYAGHGIPDELTKNAYILPTDGDIADISTCYKLQAIYNQLSKTKAGKSIVLLDACFTGSIRGAGMIESSRGIAMKPKKDQVSGNIIVISACQGDQSAFPFPDKSHGLFTYFLLKALNDSAGQISIGHLFQTLQDNITKTSLILNGREQRPSISIPQEFTTKLNELYLY